MFASPVYLRRRLMALLSVVALVVVASYLWPGDSSGARVPVRHVVRPGETVWSIASSAYGGDPRAHLAQIEQRNHLHGATIAVGDVLVLP
jgi:hypothetical protein